MPDPRRAIVIATVALVLILAACGTGNPVIGDPSGTTTTTAVGA